MGATLALALALLEGSPLQAQSRQYKFGRLTEEQGLSHFRVYDLAQDRHGFLWVATLSGLDRYDGYGFRTFRHQPDNTSSLSDDIVTAILFDRHGRLWAGTREGALNAFDPLTEKFTRFLNDPADSTTVTGSQISTLYEDRSGTLWVGTAEAGLSRMTISDTNVSFIHFRYPPDSPTSPGRNRILSLLEDSRGTLWVGTGKGLDTLDRRTGQFIHLSLPASGPQGSVSAIIEDAAGDLWIGTAGSGLYYWHTGRTAWRRYRSQSGAAPGLTSDLVTCVLEDGTRFLWVGTTSGLNRLDRQTGHIEQHHHSPDNPNGLVHDDIKKLRRDTAGNIWIVTDRGLNMLTPRMNQFAHYIMKPDGTGDQTVSALWEDKRGNLWLGMDGVRMIDARTGRTTRFTSDGLDGAYVQAFHEDADGNLWIGTLGNGLYRYDGTRFTRYDWASSIMSVSVDRDGVVWAGAYEEGLFRFNQRSKQLTHFLHDPADTGTLSSNNVFTVMHDASGILWVGTEGGGLNRFEVASSTFQRFTHSPSAPTSVSNDRVYALFEDRQGRMWIATGNGLNEFNRETGTFTNLFTGTDFVSSQLTSITQDRRGSLWLGTMQQGLIRVTPEKDMVTSFDMQDGLPGNSFPYARCLRKDGTLLFGGNRGLVAFHPDSIHENLFSPNVALTSFKIFDRAPALDTAITEAHTLRLDFNENYFSFEFASLDFSAPARNRFRYTLEGFDKEWATTARRFAYYTNVDPGEYTLRVVASNGDGVWSSNDRTLHLVIAPPYWATWWFRGLVLVVVMALLVGGYHYRVRKLLEMERMRLRIAGDLHDDIGSSLGSIALLSDLIRSSGNLAPDQTNLLHEISKSARLTADSLRDIVWVINPAHDKLDNMVLRMKDAAASMLGNIEHSFHCSDQIMAGVLDMEFRRNILLIYKEILHNILKHARATRVEIRFEENDGHLMLTVSDNGVGFDPSQSFSGNGLRNLKSRAEKVGGRLEIRSVKENGASVVLTAKIP